MFWLYNFSILYDVSLRHEAAVYLPENRAKLLQGPDGFLAQRLVVWRESAFLFVNRGLVHDSSLANFLATLQGKLVRPYGKFKQWAENR